MPKQSKKNTTSEPVKKKRKKGIKLFHAKFPGQEPRVEIRPTAVADIETTLPEPTDKASRHKYPPPKRDPLFRTKWMRFIDNISRRENFNKAHLDSLEILCDLYVEYETLQTFLRVNGRSYLSVGRSGEVWKFYPEMGQLARVQAQIKEYTKMLGLLLKKDHGNESDAEKGEWD